MTICGIEAIHFDAVRLDDFSNANKGPLTYADTDTGLVVYKDVTGEEKRVELGAHSITILRRGR